MKNKKILFIVNGFGVGGVETYIRQVNQRLQKLKVQTYLHCWDYHLKNDPALFQAFRCIELKGFFIPFTGQPINFIKHNLSLLNFLRANKPDLVILNVSKSAIYSYGLLKFLQPFLKYKIIYQFHGSEYLEKTYKIKDISKIKKLKYWIYYYLEKFVYTNSSQIFVFSNFSKEKILEKIFKVNPSKIKIIRPGKTLSVKRIGSKRQIKKELGLNPNQPLILVVSRLEIRKGLFEILKIFEKLYEKNKKINFLVSSDYTGQYDFKQRNKFFKTYQNLSPQPLIKFLQIDRQQSLGLLYSAADLFLIPSVSMETFGFTTLESFSHGTPVAGYKIGANPELIKHNYNGFIRPLSQRDALVEDIESYLKSKAPTKEKIQKNCLSSAQNYSWNNYIKAILYV